jgi:predicted proteasome-type protease
LNKSGLGDPHLLFVDRSDSRRGGYNEHTKIISAYRRLQQRKKNKERVLVHLQISKLAIARKPKY